MIFLRFFISLLTAFGLLIAGISGQGVSATQSYEIIVKPKQLNAPLSTFGQIKSYNKELGFYVLQIQSKYPIAKVLQQLNQQPFIEYAEENMILSLNNKKTFPNDPLFKEQYGLKRVNATKAWKTTQGSPQTMIAVIDTGVDYNHPDLKGQVIKGKDFVDQDEDPMDENGHGTHCSGISAAITNNQIGIAGMAPKVKVLAVRVLNADGDGYLADVTNGITYAADRGAKVISLSLGSSRGSHTLQRAIQYAKEKGSIIIAAAGNDGTSLPTYPAYYSNVIAVAATDKNDRKASFSNYGHWVDLAAPGVDIISTWLNNNYQNLSGTSMSTPFVAGIAGLLASEGKSPQQIEQILKQTADPITGTGLYWNHGRVNAAKAVKK